LILGIRITQKKEFWKGNTKEGIQDLLVPANKPLSVCFLCY
jgi:hypothetical protein